MSAEYHEILLDDLDDIETPVTDSDPPTPFTERDPGHVPTPEEDPFNALTRICHVQGAADGLLHGMRVAVKDLIPVAGVPLTAGARFGVWEDPPVPTQDAVTVARLLAAGASITGKTNMGLGTGRAYYGETRNPHNLEYSTGGSSSGSGAAIAGGLADAALGTDAGGSIRRPAAWCGVVGLMPTAGLIPCYAPTEDPNSLLGPMSKTVSENAAMLQVLAGPDWKEPIWTGADAPAGDYLTNLKAGVEGLRIGVVTESLEAAGCTPETLARFSEARAALEEAGAIVEEVSIPIWPHCTTIWLVLQEFAILSQSYSLKQNTSRLGWIDSVIIERIAEHITPGISPVDAKAQVRSFARAQNLRLECRRQVDLVLDRFDVLITPTVPTGPSEFRDSAPPTDGKRTLRIDKKVIQEGTNTRPLNLSRHPALTVPMGLVENSLPNGLQIIGRRFGEELMYRVGFALESARAAGAGAS